MDTEWSPVEQEVRRRLRNFTDPWLCERCNYINGDTCSWLAAEVCARCTGPRPVRRVCSRDGHHETKRRGGWNIDGYCSTCGAKTEARLVKWCLDSATDVKALSLGENVNFRVRHEIVTRDAKGRMRDMFTNLVDNNVQVASYLLGLRPVLTHEQLDEWALDETGTQSFMGAVLGKWSRDWNNKNLKPRRATLRKVCESMGLVITDRTARRHKVPWTVVARMSHDIGKIYVRLPKHYLYQAELWHLVVSYVHGWQPTGLRHKM